jgi:hypothetical protein
MNPNLKNVRTFEWNITYCVLAVRLRAADIQPADKPKSDREKLVIVIGA